MVNRAEEDIAIVGIGLRFPSEASSPDDFFELLVRGRSARKEVPPDRWTKDSFYHPDSNHAGTMSMHHAHFLEGDISTFDAPFFSITPNEAGYTDPQQRLLLETVYHALENAGIPMPKAVGSNTSVHIGCFNNDYEKVLSWDPEVDLTYMPSGVSSAMLSNRLSWFYDFTGPSITLDTACSSSLNAVYLGYNSLRSGEVDMAVAGGCNLFFMPDMNIFMDGQGYLSPDGICYAFDHRANGYARGEGVGIVVLKRLSDAIRDGDTIRAVIRGTSSNQDGRSPGLTQPTRASQAALIRQAYRMANLTPKDTMFFESHGTGTPVGDPIEASAISDVFTEWRSSDSPLFVGALKTNIGHLEAAAGVAGLIKAVGVVESGIIPPNLYMEKINPKIPAEAWHLKFPTECMLYPGGDNSLRRASVNTFGFGGSNVHIIIDDAYSYLTSRGLKGSHRTVIHPKFPRYLSMTNGHAEKNGQLEELQDGSSSNDGLITPSALKKRLFALSAYDESGVRRVAESYRSYLVKQLELGNIDTKETDTYLRDLSYTLASKRTSFPWRSSIIASSIPSLLESLANFPAPIRASADGKIGLLFTGQGAQWATMGSELFKFSVFRQSLDKATDYLKEELGCSWSLNDELLKGKEHGSLIGNAAYSQPICTALQIGLVGILRDSGVQFEAVVGHSSGEIAAAYAVGAISSKAAWKIAYYRGLLSANLAVSDGDGAMMSVGLGPEKALEYIKTITNANNGPGVLTIACYNSPRNVTVSGSNKMIDAMKELLDEASVFNRKLKVDNAYHSAYMQKIAEEYRHYIEDIEPGVLDHIESDASKTYSTFYSSLTGSRLASLSKLQSPDYWIDNLVSPVRFSDAVTSMLNDRRKKAKKLGAAREQTLDPITEFVEVGPHSTLQGPLREIIGKLPNAKDIGYISLLKRNTEASDTILSALGWLNNRGQNVNINAINTREAGESSQPSPAAMIVNLPQYPFNHSKSYWRESRLSKSHRFRERKRLHLLGTPVVDWNKSNAIWRNWLRLSESPWIEHHSITGSVIYPGAGMLVMAIEASLQLVNPDKKLRGIRFKDVVFQVALRVPATAEGIETQFIVRPYSESASSTSSTWNEFQLSSYDNDEWRVHCRGLVQPDYESPLNPIDNGLEQRSLVQDIQDTVERANVACQTPVSRAQLYELLSTVGTQYGPAFQTVYDITIDEELGVVSTIKAPSNKALIPSGYVQPHLIHPTTLDGILQLSTIAYTRGGRESTGAFVPASIDELWIAADVERSHSSIRVSAKSTGYGLRQFSSTMKGVDSQTKEPLFTLDGFLLTLVTNHAEEASDGAHYHQCYNIDWKPDATLLTQPSLSKDTIFALPEALAQKDPTDIIAKLESLCFAHLRRYLERRYAPGRVPESKPWLQKYVDWAQYQMERYARGELLHATKEWEILANDDTALSVLEAEVEHMCPEGPLASAIGRNLGDVLDGKIDALETLFRPEMTEPVYRHGTGIEISNQYLSMYFDVLAHKNSNLVILEIGGGTGGSTVPVIETLCRHGDTERGVPRFERYDFTDISPSFLERAHEKLHQTADRMRFQTLNIENDPLQQGFEAEQYDVILAANVLHATKSIDNTLRMVRKLLKPGGKLVIYEVTVVSTIRSTFSFGLLPGWWLSDEPNRRWGAPLSVAEWDTHLRRTGFSGIDLEFEDASGPKSEYNKLHSILVSTAESPQQPHRPLPSTVIIINDKSVLQAAIAGELKKSLLSSSRAPECEIIPLEKLPVEEWKQKFCIFLQDVEGEALLENIDDPTFKALQKMLADLDSILWLSQGGGPKPWNPNSELITGFSRVARQENPLLRFITLSFEKVKDSESVVNSTLAIIGASLSAKSDNDTVIDNNFYETQDGVVQIGRIVEATYMNEAVVRKTTQALPQPGAFGGDPNRALKLVIGSPGLLDTLHFIDDPVYDQPLKEGEVEYKVMAAGLNFLDIMVALGQVVGNELGIEASGIITRAGPNSKFKVGDRVCGDGLGTIATYARTKEQCVAKIPDSMSFALAAGFGVVFITAYVAIFESANIQPGETILIHAGAGGVGQSCIQLAKIRGAEIYVTVGSVAKRDLLINHYGIPKDHIFSSRDLTFAQGIMRMTKGRGVDVAINCLSGDALRATWDLMAPFGRFIEIGKRDIYASTRLSMEKFKHCVRFECIDLRYMARSGSDRFSRYLEALLDLVRQGKISDIVPLNQVPFSQTQEAFRSLQGGANSGKIILVPNEEDIVPIVPSRKTTYTLDPNATFVICGGFGGIGKSICKWIVSRGAKYLIILSRSGASDTASKELVEELELNGTVVKSPKCDVSDAGALKKALDKCAADGMPPVKGCIQASMVLRDAMFSNMTLSEYYTALKPKLDASWNLHNLLPKDLDFFVLLSSISGIVGNAGQANYASGNTFQDALARYRVLNGLKATSIDVGAVLSVGYLAEQTQKVEGEGSAEIDLTTHMRNMGIRGIREDELLAIIEALCDPGLPTPTSSNIKTQVVLGLQVPEVFTASGLDEPIWFRDPLFTHLHRIRLQNRVDGGDNPSQGNRSINYGLLLAAAESVDAGIDIVYGALATKLVRALNIPPDEVQPSKALTTLGVDSLVAVEIRTFILKQLDADVSVFDLMDLRSLRALSELVVTRSGFTKTVEEQEE